MSAGREHEVHKSRTEASDWVATPVLEVPTTQSKEWVPNPAKEAQVEYYKWVQYHKQRREEAREEKEGEEECRDSQGHTDRCRQKRVSADQDEQQLEQRQFEQIEASLRRSRQMLTAQGSSRHRSRAVPEVSTAQSSEGVPSPGGEPNEYGPEGPSKTTIAQRMKVLTVTADKYLEAKIEYYKAKQRREDARKAEGRALHDYQVLAKDLAKQCGRDEQQDAEPIKPHSLWKPKAEGEKNSYASCGPPGSPTTQEMPAAAKDEEMPADKMPKIEGKVLSARDKVGNTLCAAYQTGDCSAGDKCPQGRHSCAVLLKSDRQCWSGRVCNQRHKAQQCWNKKAICPEQYRLGRGAQTESGTQRSWRQDLEEQEATLLAADQCHRRVSITKRSIPNPSSSGPRTLRGSVAKAVASARLQRSVAKAVVSARLTTHGPKPPNHGLKVRQYWKGEEPPTIDVLCSLIRRTIEDNRKRREANAARDNEELGTKVHDLLQRLGVPVWSTRFPEGPARHGSSPSRAAGEEEHRPHTVDGGEPCTGDTLAAECYASQGEDNEQETVAKNGRKKSKSMPTRPNTRTATMATVGASMFGQSMALRIPKPQEAMAAAFGSLYPCEAFEHFKFPMIEDLVNQSPLTAYAEWREEKNLEYDGTLGPAWASQRDTSWARSRMGKQLGAISHNTMHTNILAPKMWMHKPSLQRIRCSCVHGLLFGGFQCTLPAALGSILCSRCTGRRNGCVCSCRGCQPVVRPPTRATHEVCSLNKAANVHQAALPQLTTFQQSPDENFKQALRAGGNPTPTELAAANDEDLEFAEHVMCKKGEKLGEYRRKARAAMKELNHRGRSVTTRIREMQPEPVWQVTRTRDAGMIGLVAILLHWPGMSHAYHMLVGFPAVGHAPWCQVFSAKPAQGVELSHVSGGGTERPESAIKDFGQTRIEAMMSTRLTPPAQRPAGWAEFRTLIHAMVKKEDGTIMPLCTWKRKEDKAAARVKANQ